MDWKTGRMRLTFELESDVSSSIDKMKDKPLRIVAKQWREKRSLDANAYYWVLLSRLAEVAGISKPRAHNLMLRRYGQNLMISGQMAYLVVPDTTEAEETALEAEKKKTEQELKNLEGLKSDTTAYVKKLDSSLESIGNELSKLGGDIDAKTS